MTSTYPDVHRPSAEHLSGFLRDCEALAKAAGAKLDAPVRSCPGWVMADLVRHTGGGHRWVDAALRGWASGRRAPPGRPTMPPERRLLDWFEAGAASLATSLEELDPDDIVGTLMWNSLDPPFPVPSLWRLQALETGLHRWDAQAVAGEAGAIDDDLAADWIDDLLGSWLVAAARAGRQAQGQAFGDTLHLDPGGTDGGWLVERGSPGEVAVRRGVPPAMTAPPGGIMVRGPASKLVLLLLNRIDAAEPGLEVEGDPTVLGRWRQDVRYGTPAAANGEHGRHGRRAGGP